VIPTATALVVQIVAADIELLSFTGYGTTALDMQASIFGFGACPEPG